MQYDFFIASRWRNKSLVDDLAVKIRAAGKTVYNFTQGDGSDYELKNLEQKLTPEAFMEKFESIQDWQHDHAVKEVFDLDMKSLGACKKLILLLPAGKSAHIEAGVAYGLGKECILIGKQDVAESVYLIFSQFYTTPEEFLVSL